MLEKYIPYNMRGNGSIIVTTQKTLTSQSVHLSMLELQPLSDREGCSLLFAIRKGPVTDEEKRVGDEISAWVGGLPLAIVTLSGYIKYSVWSVAEILDCLHQSSRIWVSGTEIRVVSEKDNYERTWENIFEMALSEISPNSRHLIQILAFLNPSGIPEELLKMNHKILSLELSNGEDEDSEDEYVCLGHFCSREPYEQFLFETLTKSFV